MSEINVMQQLGGLTEAFKEFFEHGDVPNMESTLKQVKVLEGRLMYEIFKVNQKIRSVDITSNDKFLKLSNLKDDLQLVRKYKTGMDSDIKSGKFVFKIREVIEELRDTDVASETEDDIAVDIPIQTMTESTKTPVQQRGTTMVLFHKKGCPFCDEMMGEWVKFASENENNPNIKVKTVECTQGTKGHSFAQKFNITGYPTILRFRNGDKVEFTGDRKAINFRNFVLN